MKISKRLVATLILASIPLLMPTLPLYGDERPLPPSPPTFEGEPVEATDPGWRPPPPPPRGENDAGKGTIADRKILSEEIGIAPSVKELEPLQPSPEVKTLRLKRREPEKKEGEKRIDRRKQLRREDEVFERPTEFVPPDGIGTRYNCRAINFEAADDKPICAMEKRIAQCIKAPCPDLPPEWVNYPNVETACRKGDKIIEYAMGECRKVLRRSK